MKENLLTDTMVGSPLYMAPEIIQGQSYGEKADVWSLGILFYEILVGKNLFEGEDNICKLIDCMVKL